MKVSVFRPAAVACLLSLAGGLSLSSCNSEPKATDADKTATVVDSETNAASDSAATTVRADSSAMGTDSTMAK
ncbi:MULTISPECIES: hypothetical protein [Hymenobacter]|uniref:Entericidin n=1 Tax=Hymenobacter armeniacus TaxID=2771358 RepID=A0ABR8JRL5_9BACT|nr:MULTISPECIES: hypothetical protein [Hymenobacter]MBD2722614.1 hypothetical protein [Hymenobacter armeniacus]MBJ6109669.1 hypothetical protein [Hymenobacter sp. BT523]